MCRACATLIAEFVRSSLAGSTTTDLSGLARDLRMKLPHISEAELMARIDAAVIGCWGTVEATPRGGTNPRASHEADPRTLQQDAEHQ